MKKLTTLLILLCLSACATVNAPAPDGKPQHPLVLISIDAFRADYYGRGLTPNLKALADGGARGSMRPAFPSLTFPNHYTLVTGKTPDHHGMIANYMYDPTYPGAGPDNRLGYFDKKSTDGFWWDEATPVWVSAERAGLTAASVYWPGSQADIGGVKLALSPEWDKTSTSETRVAQILQWMDLPAAQRPQLYLLYFDQVDEEGHHHGPDSPELNTALGEVDTAIGHLIAGMKARGIDADIIVVSDHGMISVSPQRTTYISDVLGGSLPEDAKTDPRYDLIYWGSLAMLNPKPGHEAELDKLTKTHFDHMQCWHRGDIPARYKYGKNPRVTEIVCLGEPGWQVGGIASRGIGTDVGNHGYDPAIPEMRAIFITNGPDIKPGVKLATFDNVDVYSLEMRLLHLTPEPGDGNLGPLKPALAR